MTLNKANLDAVYPIDDVADLLNSRNYIFTRICNVLLVTRKRPRTN